MFPNYFTIHYKNVLKFINKGKVRQVKEVCKSDKQLKKGRT